ncbi:MAG: hypothetical protein J6B00_02510 [Alphaproteobacteria bacterium]|nr:hypothetical protein [Alphaproteobacteria bacterium]MBO5441640.1 hypothetical protein [Alphaproteobacteria bacterium]
MWRNSFFVFCCLVMFFRCGRVAALPQDWGCGAIEVAEVSRAADVGGFIRLQYAGEKDGVRMKVEFFADEDNPYKADLECGNQGCYGEFEDVASGKREEMNFYCYEGESEEGRVSCYPVNWRVWRLEAVSDGRYAMRMCGGTVLYTLNLEDCDKEQCVLQKTAADDTEQRVERKCVPAGENGGAMICMDLYEYEGSMGSERVSAF